MKLSVKEIKQIIREELRSVLGENEFSSEILSLLNSEDEEEKIQAVHFAESLGMEEFKDAKKYTLAYLGSIIADQWVHPTTGKPFSNWAHLDEEIEALKALRKIEDPHEFVQKYKQFFEKHDELDLVNDALPAFMYKVSDDEPDGESIKVFDPKFVNLHNAYYLEGLLKGAKIDPNVFQWKEPSENSLLKEEVSYEGLLEAMVDLGLEDPDGMIADMVVSSDPQTVMQAFELVRELYGEV